MTDMPPQEMNNEESQNEQGVRIPVSASQDKRGKIAPDVDSLVREYEMKYGTFRDDESPAVRQGASSSYSVPKPKSRPVTAPRDVLTTDNERMWATIAHASVLLTLLIGLPTAGVATLFTLFIPLMVYMYYREKSEFVAYHALQAFVLQLIGTVGWVMVLVVGWLAAAILILVLAITIIGIPVALLLALAMIVFTVASFGLPLGMIVFGLIAAWEAYQGKWYRLPYIGLWLEKQMYGGFLKHI
jgi:uncharacterized Tic20 family protein